MLKSLSSILSREKVSSEPACPSLVQDTHSPVSQAAPSSSAELVSPLCEERVAPLCEDFNLLQELSWIHFGMFMCDHEAMGQPLWLGSFLVNFGGFGVSFCRYPSASLSLCVFCACFLQLSVQWCVLCGAVPVSLCSGK